jgi:hypothetical protein
MNFVGRLRRLESVLPLLPQRPEGETAEAMRFAHLSR